MTDILEHMYKVREYAIYKNIKEAMIIVDRDVAYINQLYIKDVNGGFLTIPECVMGMKVKYESGLADRLGVNFIITEDKHVPEPFTKTLADYSTDELLDEIRRRTSE